MDLSLVVLYVGGNTLMWYQM